MKRVATPAELRSAATLEKEAGDAAWLNGHPQAANAYWIRSARHNKAADKLEKKEGGR